MPKESLVKIYDGLIFLSITGKKNADYFPKLHL